MDHFLITFSLFFEGSPALGSDPDSGFEGIRDSGLRPPHIFCVVAGLGNSTYVLLPIPTTHTKNVVWADPESRYPSPDTLEPESGSEPKVGIRIGLKGVSGVTFGPLSSTLPLSDWADVPEVAQHVHITWCMHDASHVMHMMCSCVIVSWFMWAEIKHTTIYAILGLYHFLDHFLDPFYHFYVKP